MKVNKKMTKSKIINEEGRKEYDVFMNNQFRILQGHFSRIMLRCYNKFTEIANKEIKIHNTIYKEVKS